VQAAARARARARGYSAIGSFGTDTITTLATGGGTLERNRMIIAGAADGIAGQSICTYATQRTAAGTIAACTTGGIGDRGQATATRIAQYYV
jgi:hypothetical protein